LEKELLLFRPQQEIILNYVRKHGLEKISTYSATTGIPLLIIYSYIIEEIPEWKEVSEAKIKELKIFYNIKE